MNHFDEDGDEILFQEFASKEDATRIAPKCPSCGVNYHDHIGLNVTCKKLQTVFALVEAHFDGPYYSCTPASRAMCRAILQLKGGVSG